MFKALAAGTLIALGAMSLPTYAGEDGSPCHYKDSEIPTVTIKEAQAKKATFVDSNSPQTREKFGVIPGAILVSNYAKFQPDKELPKKKDTSLVFYCANERCGASKKSAKKAIDSGYTDVAVLPVGVMGWKKAGLELQKATDKGTGRS